MVRSCKNMVRSCKNMTQSCKNATPNPQERNYKFPLPPPQNLKTAIRFLKNLSVVVMHKEADHKGFQLQIKSPFHTIGFDLCCRISTYCQISLCKLFYS